MTTDINHNPWLVPTDADYQLARQWINGCVFHIKSMCYYFVNTIKEYGAATMSIQNVDPQSDFLHDTSVKYSLLLL